MLFTVYILKSEKDGKRYVGFTDDVQRRLAEHNLGLVQSTKNRRPLRLIYTENYNTKTEALSREKFFKTGFGRSLLKKKGL